MFVCCDCCVLSGRGLCDELITRPEEYYRLWCVVVCNLENLVNEEALAPWGGGDCCAKKNKNVMKSDSMFSKFHFLPPLHFTSCFREVYYFLLLS